jgi:hypothetical protein
MYELRTSTEAAPGDSPGVAIRELAQRRSGTVEVLLLWHVERDAVEVALYDSSTDAGFEIEVAPGHALDAFYHPYAYAPTAATPGHAFEAVRTGDDG